ncbi:hypothetical protein [Qipengyuania sp.]|uniref:hypothetical protein n=1 Tax=Qipengyuania sp. TaxID=2004515 RepID=UPI003AF4409B
MAKARIHSISTIALLLALGACGPAPERDTGQAVACALDGAEEFTGHCRLVEVGEGEGAYFVMRHPDGGFRKLAPADTPSGYVEFDGAQEARSWREGDDVVLAIGPDRYRWEEPRDD